jgi:hypothetical protein
MSAAALTPRVRILAVCDEALPSEIEDGVFTLEGVRQGFTAKSSPCVRALTAYLLLSYSRRGRFEGELKLVALDEEKTIRMARFTADFAGASGGLALAVDLGDCTFPQPGTYSIEVHFVTSSGAVLKGEQSFLVWPLEE